MSSTSERSRSRKRPRQHLNQSPVHFLPIRNPVRRLFRKYAHFWRLDKLPCSMFNEERQWVYARSRPEEIRFARTVQLGLGSSDRTLKNQTAGLRPECPQMAQRGRVERLWSGDGPE